MSEEIVPIPVGLIEFAQRLFGPSVDQAGLILGDWARLWRAKNLLSIKERMDRILQEKGFDPRAARHLSLSVGLPLMERASYQDDPYLQERWAYLIANSLDPEDRSKNSFSLDITYIEALHQFSQLDCEVLEFVVQNGVESYTEKGVAFNSLEPDEITAAFPNSPIHISLEKLASLGCVSIDPKIPLRTGGAREFREGISPTLLGINLCLEASGKKPSWWGSLSN